MERTGTLVVSDAELLQIAEKIAKLEGITFVNHEKAEKSKANRIGFTGSLSWGAWWQQTSQSWIEWSQHWFEFPQRSEQDTSSRYE